MAKNFSKGTPDQFLQQVQNRIAELGGGIESATDIKASADLVDWLADHDQAWNDCQDYFGKDPNEVDRAELQSWVDEHDQLADDYKNYCVNCGCHSDKEDEEIESCGTIEASVDIDKLYEIANDYITSRPVPDDWGDETQKELHAIMEGLGVTEAKAKELMIEVLGFSEEDFKKEPIKSATDINDDMIYAEDKDKLDSVECGDVVYEDIGGTGLGELGDRYTLADLEKVYNDGKANNGDPSIAQYDSFDDWLYDTVNNGYLKEVYVSSAYDGLYNYGADNYDEVDDGEYWERVDSKDVQDSDGFYTEYTLYTNPDRSKFICMFGDSDIYTPSEDYADFETEDEEEAYDWFYNYEGFEDESLAASTKVEKTSVTAATDDAREQDYRKLAKTASDISDALDDFTVDIDDINEKYGDVSDFISKEDIDAMYKMQELLRDIKMYIINDFTDVEE